MGYLLDTSALSEAIRRRPREAFMDRLRRTSSQDLFTSTVCVIELRYGCALKGDAELWRRLESEVLDLISLLPFGPEEAIRCGELLAELTKKGNLIGIEDTQIGATALAHDLTIVTFNTKHFTAIPALRVENWLA